jgi:hypothetical protein
MLIPDHPFFTTDWREIESETISGETGIVIQKIKFVGDIRIRMLDYSANYLADHWCTKGHIIQCLEGEIQLVFDNGKESTLMSGMTFAVGDESSSHKTFSKNGCKLFIID